MLRNIFPSLLTLCLAVHAQAPLAATENDHTGKLDTILESQSDAVKARYPYRHPKETLLFFGIEPGMTVLEGLPGQGWYTRILLPYLGKEGHLIGVDYPADIWPRFEWASEEFVEQRLRWASTWPDEVKAWNIENGASVSAYTFTTLPEDLSGKVDAVLFIRALHNMARFGADGGYFSQAMREAHRVLKPGGVLGVVQHATTDGNATGETGYLERDSLVERIESHRFKLAGESAVNANPKDKADGIVWRLPPSLVTSREDAELRERFEAIGESNRMTLKFVKPPQQ